ncbi:M23 family metallopeptidase [Nocardioides sp.]|uniref:murein hydrolase activator EnvC family protein n=1 Tax=Nocardioides sp. TaxID=35761 RepID=UPI001A1ACDC6|nr:M23 family metallopeptidase [Nocardioides sp.]MBJ7355887.1 peptidoglycan DD-metalloendopeptidase family protein [Nocardioides sp.]
MRYFPGASHRRALRRTLAVPALVGVLTIPAATQIVPALSLSASSADPDDLRAEREEVRQQIRDAQQEAEESSNRVARAVAAYTASQAELAAAKADLASTRKELYAAQALDASMQAALVEAEARLVQAQADVVAGQQALEAQRAVVKDLVVDLYQQGDPTLVSISGYLGAQSPSDLIRHEEYADSASAKQKGIFDDLIAAEVLLQVREDEVAAARDDVATRRAAAAENLATMQRLTDQAVAEKARFRGLVDSNAAKKREARAARQADLRMLEKLKREEARIKKKIAAAVAAAEAAAAAAGDNGFTGQSDGFLDYPVAGRVTSPFGYRTHPIYGYYGLHDGTDFGAGCGSALRAVADGTVVSAYYSSVYGNRLYVSVGRVNGASLVAVYNHASSYRVGVGDRVTRGQTVGYVGSTGWSTGCHLHFTIMKNGDAVDPMGYL